MIDIFHCSRLALCVSLLSAISAPAFAEAEQDGSAANSGGIPDIVVTAQKRSESLSKTPLAVSVIGQQSLDNVGARSFTDGIKTIPSVSTGIGGTLAIRGLGTLTQSQENGTVAFHIDGIFQNSLGQGSAPLYDVQRVEVLRGPQGTLYGRNATAGVVNVITNDPSQKFETFGDVSYGKSNALLVRGVINVPVNDMFAVRLSGTYENSDSWKVFNGSHPRDKDSLVLRLGVQAKISDRITWNGKVDYAYDNTQAAVGAPTYIYSGGVFTPAGNPTNEAGFPSTAGTNGLQAPAFFIPYNSVYRGVDFDKGNTRPTEGVAFRSNLRFDLNDALSLTYLMGYSHVNQKPGYLSFGAFQISYAKPRLADDWSHEIDLNYNSDKFKGVLGLYSFDHTLDEQDFVARIFNPVVLPGNVVDFRTPSVEVSSFTPRDRATTRAVFGQGTYSLTDSLRLTAGVRYNWDKASFGSYTYSQCPFGSGLSAAQPNVATFPAFIPGLGGAPVCSTFSAFAPNDIFVNRAVSGGEKNFHRFSWKGSLEYDLNPDALLYATVSTGYKTGGVGDRQAIGDARFFLPETNINYEVGVRTKLLNRTVSLNLTGFWTDYKNLQVQRIDPNDPTKSIPVNAGKARSRGIEFEYVWAPTAADRIQGFATYLDAKFRDFLGVNDFTALGQQFAGNALPGSPKFSARIGYSHIFDLGDAGTITPTAQFYYQSTAYTSFVQNVATRIPDYTRSDLFIRYETAQKHFSIDAYVNNIEDKARIAAVNAVRADGSAYAIAFRSDPRTYGIRLGFRY